MLRPIRLVPRIASPALEFIEIKSLPEEAYRPFWSVMIPTYNRPELLAKTLKSVLMQAPGPREMQIGVLDNCSTIGDIEGIVREVGQGRVEYYRHEKNIHWAMNFNACLQRANGYWVHVLHDDDMVIEGFYDAYRAVIEAHPDCSAVVGSAVLMDENDRWYGVTDLLPHNNGLLESIRATLLTTNPFVFPAVALRREALEKVGGFALGVIPFDWEMWVRLMMNGVTFTQVERPYTLYRVSKIAASQKYQAERRTITQFLSGSAAVASYIADPLEREQLVARHHQVFSLYCADIARRFKSQRQLHNALFYAVWSFRFEPALSRFYLIVQVSLLVIVQPVLRWYRRGVAHLPKCIRSIRRAVSLGLGLDRP